MNKIAEFRKKNGLTQKELAKELNVTSGAVGMWELDKRRPPLDKAKKIAEYFNTTIDKIFFYSEEGS